ncbi:MAG: ATP-binding cassette domain-containing protein [Chloroflexota bacterium]
MDIAAIDYWANSGTSRLHRSSALAKGIAALGFVAATVMASSPFLLAAIYLLLVAGVFATKLPARRLFAIAAYPTLFALLFAASRWDGGLATPAVVLLKTLTAAQAMVLLITTTPYPDLFAALGRAMPGLLADGLFVTYRSFFMLMREMDRMVTALRLRGGLRPRRLASNLGTLSRALGTLLVRAVDLSERLYAVLRVRGYRGRLVAGDRWRSLSRNDLIPLSTAALALTIAVAAALWPALWASANGVVLLGAGLFAGTVLLVQKGRGGGGRESGDGETRSREDAETRRTQDPALRTQDPGPRTQDSGLATHHSSDEVARVSCVRHVYPDGTEVSLCGLDFVAHRGERVVILGPNGAGKSTLLNHLLGLLRPTEGEVVVLGHDPSREFGAIQPRVGVLLQNVDEQLLGPTVADDVAFGARNAGYSESDARALARRAMERLGVLHLADKVPHYLSGGQKRKVALAGALVTDPELLVLDEPFEGLDPRSRGELVALLNDLHRERDLAIIVTTHHIDLLPLLADTVYLLVDGGRIVASGTPMEVFSRPGLLRESSIEPPALTLLFQRLAEEGVDLGMPIDLEDATRRLLALAKERASA